MRSLVRFARNLSMLLAALSLVAISVLVPVGVVSRYLANSPIGWIEPIAAILLVAFTFFSASVTMADRLHVCVNTFVNLMSERMKIVNANIANILLLILLIVLTVCSWELVESTLGQALPEVPALPAAIVYAVVPLGFGLMALPVLAKLLTQDFEENEREKEELHLD